MRAGFEALADHAVGQVRGTEVLLLNFSAERSDFVRFNLARVRQPGTVLQASLRLELIDGGRHAAYALPVGGDAGADRAAVAAAIAELRSRLPALAPDPYLLYAQEPASSERVGEATPPRPEQAIEAVIEGAGDADFVGVLASGPVWRGFANSLGQRNWHAIESFQLDWSIYAPGQRDKAVKTSIAGQHWDQAEVVQGIRASCEQVPLLARPARRIEPGDYRAWLSPAAVAEVIGLLAWDGFSLKARRTRQSPLQFLEDGSASLSPQVGLAENTAAGLAPGFDNAGFLKPARIELVVGGRNARALASARSAREFDVAPDGAGEGEAPQSIEMGAGTLAAADALAALDRGIWVSNLWYLNYSDRPAGRMTGMTRFATFWVEQGRLVAPLEVMRFDDSIYRMLGSELEGLGARQELIQSTLNYGERSLETARVPGALLRALHLSL